MIRTTRFLSFAALAAVLSLCTAPSASATALASWPHGGNHGGGGCGGDNDRDDDRDDGCNHGHKNNCKHKNHGCNNKPNPCDAGGPYTVECGPGPLVVAIDASDSDGATAYLWSTNYPSGSFGDATAAQTTFSFNPNGCCNQEVRLYLTITTNKGSRTCETKVRVRDTQAPTIECPPLAKLFCGDDTSPENTGWATAFDNCDTNVQITYKDKIVLQDCRAERLDHTIERTWKARDNCGNKAECVQFIHVVKQTVLIDALPGVCPNVVDLNSCEPVRVAILGTPTFDVNRIAPSSVRLYGEHCDGGPVCPIAACRQDVATPFVGDLSNCECSDLNGDGITDLVLSFRRSTVICEFGLANLPEGSSKRVMITGRLDCNGCTFLGTDCIRVP